MHTIEKIIIYLLIMLLFLLCAPTFAGEQSSIDERFRALVEKRTEKRFDTQVTAADNTSFDEAAALASGDWTALAKAYPNPLASEIERVGAPSAKVLAAWWDVLGDEVLTNLIGRTLQNNRDLRVARSRVVESRAQLGISRANLLPWLDNADSWTRSGSSTEVGGTGKTVDLTRLAVDASWEIDVFGGTRQRVKADAAALEARVADLHDTWVSLSSEVALNYISLRTLQERLRIAQSNLELQHKTLAMVQARYDVGVADLLALNQAKYTLQETEAAIPSLRTGIEETLNALSILNGDVPGNLERDLGEWRPLPQPASSGLVGIPANALRQRPDIRSAERQLAAQVARKKSAQADLWPKFYLLGSFGLEASDSGSLISSGAGAWSFGPRITLPIFHGGAIRKNIQVQTARQEQALAFYEQTVLYAVGEVRDALTANVQELERNASLLRGVKAAQAALVSATEQYQSGLTDFNNVIDAQRSLLALEEEDAISRGEMISNLVRLFKALGGGWEPLITEKG